MLQLEITETTITDPLPPPPNSYPEISTDSFQELYIRTETEEALADLQRIAGELLAIYPVFREDIEINNIEPRKQQVASLIESFDNRTFDLIHILPIPVDYKKALKHQVRNELRTLSFAKIQLDELEKSTDPEKTLGKLGIYSDQVLEYALPGIGRIMAEFQHIIETEYEAIHNYEYDLIDTLAHYGAPIGEGHSLIIHNYVTDLPRKFKLSEAVFGAIATECIRVNPVKNKGEGVNLEVIVRVTTKHEAGKDYIVVEVSDNGVGMTTEKLEEINQKTISREENGHSVDSGLGTAFLEHYGIGYLYSSAGLGKGATVCLTFELN